ncbi:hypothetical protein HUT11_28060 [Streptomyces seoulensis]|nr:hypothetical protein HUT11_28060 [Streptomyces seoulensis]
MSGRVDSEAPAAIPRPDGAETAGPRDEAPDSRDEATAPRDETGTAPLTSSGTAPGEDEHDGAHDLAEVARRARWTAGGAGALLALAGLAAALLRLTGSAPALVGGAYAVGAALCAPASLLGLRGHTRRALWLMIAGVMVMALGDQFD